MLLVAVAYAVIGIVFGILANSADANHVRLWRLAAWVASAVVAAGQVGYEHFRLGSSHQQRCMRLARSRSARSAWRWRRTFIGWLLQHMAEAHRSLPWSRGRSSPLFRRFSQHWS